MISLASHERTKMGWTVYMCYCRLIVSTHPNIWWSLNPQSDVSAVYFIGLIKVKWDHEGRALTWKDWCPYKRRYQKARPRAAMWGCSGKVASASQEYRYHQNLTMLAPWSQTSRLQDHEHKILLLKPPHLWYYGSLDWLRHMCCTCPVIKTERKLFSQFWAPRVTQPAGYLDKRHPTTY